MSAPGADLEDVRFMTATEVAALLRVSKQTVYRLVHSGQLNGVRLGARSVRVTEESVRRYIALSVEPVPGRGEELVR